MIEVLDLDDWQNARLLRQGVELPLFLQKLGGRTRVLAGWPRSSAGRYELRLEVDRAIAVASTWRIAPKKISDAGLLMLVDRLQHELPASLALGLQQGGALAGLQLVPPDQTTIAAELLRLRRAVNGTTTRQGLASALTQITRDPHRVLTSEEVWVPRARARRVHPSRLPQAFFRPDNLARDNKPVRLPDLRVEHTFDVFENRLLKAFCRSVEERLRRLERALGGSGEAASEVATLATRLARARASAEFLSEVSTPNHLPTRLTMVLMRRPDYRNVLEGYLDFRRTARVELDDPGLDAPLENVPHLFETWGALEAITELVKAAPEEGFEVREQRLVRKKQNQFFVDVLRDGAPAVVFRSGRGERLRLIPQCHYPTTPGGLHSSSFLQKPDIAVELVQPSGKVDVLLLDPKYKLQSEESEGEIVNARPKKEDIDKMHAYRDAIRDSDGDRVVRYAAILYPGPHVHYSEGLEALPGDPAHPGELRQQLRSVFQRFLRQSATREGAESLSSPQVA